MLAIIEAAGWPIWPLLLASVFTVAIVIERFISLRQKEVAPRGLLEMVIQEYRKQGVNAEMVARLSMGSHLARIFAAGLRNVKASREVITSPPFFF